jgi:hypothetical protein
MESRFDIVTTASAVCVAAYAAIAIGYVACYDLGFSPQEIRGTAVAIAVIVAALIIIDFFGKRWVTPNDLHRQSQSYISTVEKRRRVMMRPITSVIAAAALIAAGTFMLRSRPPSIEISAVAAMPPLEELHVMAGVSKLTVQDIEDHSLVFPTAGKH